MLATNRRMARWRRDHALCCREVPGSLFDRVGGAGKQRRRHHFDGEIALDDDWVRLMMIESG